MKQIYLVVCETVVYGENKKELYSSRCNWSAHTTREKALNAVTKYIKRTKERENETRMWKVETIFIDN